MYVKGKGAVLLVYAVTGRFHNFFVFYGGREVHSRFSFAVRGSPSFVPRVFRSCFAVRGSCFAVRYGASHFTFVLRGSRFLIRGSYFLVRASQFAVRGSWFVVVLEQGGGSIYHRLFLRRKCAEQTHVCPPTMADYYQKKEEIIIIALHYPYLNLTAAAG